MTYYLIKPNEDEDLYVLMSSITDTVVMWGKRRQFIRASKKKKFQRLHLGNMIQDRLDRADRTSCDSRVLAWSWENDQEVGWRGIGWIARSEMKYVIELLDKGVPEDSEFINVFVHLFEDEEEDEDTPEDIKKRNEELEMKSIFGYYEPVLPEHLTPEIKMAKEGDI